MVYVIEQSSVLKHYGVPRRSGRYPWGSGGNAEYRDSKSFLDYIKSLFGMGMTETEVAESMGISTTQLRAYKTIARAETIASEVALAQRLKDKGWSNTAIAERMNIPEATVRNRLKPGADMVNDQLINMSNLMMDRVDETKGFIDVGTGVDRQFGMSDPKFRSAIEVAKAHGYEVHSLKVNQVTQPGQYTEIRVLGPPGTTAKDAWRARGDIQSLKAMSLDGGTTITKFQPPLYVSQDRIAVNYGSEGGNEADGLMYVRPGVEDVSIGNNRYAQVRVAVEGDRYLKGMAIYKDDLPDGVDIVFNTNKEDTGNKLDAFKKMETLPDGRIDPDLPFGSVIKRQILTQDGTEQVTSAMNIVNEEGDWEDWTVALSSQVLSKQRPSVAKEQLAYLAERRQSELDEIMSLTNPEVKRKLLESFADAADSDAVDLQAAGMLRQANQVLIPIPAMKPTEVYAPNFQHGEKVALIRHPHGGIFEIPEVTVNNKNPEAKKLLGNAADAIGINAKVAEQLSGADFDGDVVLVVPNNSGKIQSKSPLDQLKNFDPKTQYRETEGMRYMSKDNTQMEMGMISNLITDMTIKGATDSEIARAVRHSMVVIDAEKHKLNYKQSEFDNNIKQLKEKYQDGGGASTLISRAGRDTYIPERRLRRASDGGPIDPQTGELVWEPTGATKPGKLRKDGTRGPDQVIKRPVEELALVRDANQLSSGTSIEKVYATHSNRLKSMANTARREQLKVESRPANPSAKKIYASEVDSINAKLRTAQLNRPLERQAQVVANAYVEARRQQKPGMDRKEIKKISNQALQDARARTGAKKNLIEFTDKEWEAVQAGAISPTKLREIMRNTDLDKLKELATPRTPLKMDGAKKARAQAMIANGYTQAEVAQQLGVSLTTLKEGLK